MHSLFLFSLMLFSMDCFLINIHFIYQKQFNCIILFFSKSNCTMCNFCRKHKNGSQLTTQSLMVLYLLTYLHLCTGILSLPLSLSQFNTNGVNPHWNSANSVIFIFFIFLSGAIQITTTISQLTFALRTQKFLNL